MSPDLFRQIAEGRSSSPSRRLSALPASLAAHAVVLTAIVVIPLLASDVLPVVRGTEVLELPVIVHPVPPSVPAPVVRRAAPAAIADAHLAPVDAPNGVGRERLIQTEPAPAVSAPGPTSEVPGSGVPGGTGMANLDAPPAAPAGPVRVSSLIKAPIKVRDVSPIYPPVALAAHIQGIVIIEAVIGPTGEVTQARILRAKPLLDEAALAAVRQWRYTPTLVSGVPVSVILTVTVTFSLQ